MSGVLPTVAVKPSRMFMRAVALGVVGNAD
jgi:hypothetical protein